MNKLCVVLLTNIFFVLFSGAIQHHAVVILHL